MLWLAVPFALAAVWMMRRNNVHDPRTVLACFGLVSGYGVTVIAIALLTRP